MPISLYIQQQQQQHSLFSQASWGRLPISLYMPVKIPDRLHMFWLNSWSCAWITRMLIHFQVHVCRCRCMLYFQYLICQAQNLLKAIPQMDRPTNSYQPAYTLILDLQFCIKLSTWLHVWMKWHYMIVLLALKLPIWWDYPSQNTWLLGCLLTDRSYTIVG